MTLADFIRQKKPGDRYQEFLHELAKLEKSGADVKPKGQLAVYLDDRFMLFLHTGKIEDHQTGKSRVIDPIQLRQVIKEELL